MRRTAMAAPMTGGEDHAGLREHSAGEPPRQAGLKVGEVCLGGHIGGRAGGLAHRVNDGVGVFGLEAGVGQAAGRWCGCRERPCVSLPV